MRGKPQQANFVPARDAIFTPVSEEARFDPENAEGWTKADLQELFLDNPEDRFLRGEVLYVGAASSNVEWFQWLGWYPDGQVQDELYVGFKDGSVYAYSSISLSEALLFFRAGSPGGAVWDHLRIRHTTYGAKKAYRLVSGNRLWNTSSASAARHQAIPPSGEPFPGYHPKTNFAGAPGKMGQTNISLSKKKGSRKIQYFTPVSVFGQK